MAGNCHRGPQRGLAKDRPQPADPSQEWRGTACRALSQDRRGTTDHQNQPTPARSRGEPQPQPSARIGEAPPATTGSGPQPEMAGDCIRALSQDWQGTSHHRHHHQAPSKEWGKTTAPKANSQDCRGPHKDHNTPSTPHPQENTHTTHPTLTTHQHRRTRDHRPAPQRTPTTTSGRPQPGMAGRPGQALSQDWLRTTTNQRAPPADPGQEWRGKAPSALSQDRRVTTHNQWTPVRNGGETATTALSQDWRVTNHYHTQRTSPRGGGEPDPRPSARIAEGAPITTTSGPPPRVAGNRPQGPQPGSARDHPPPSVANPSRERRGTATRALSHDWRRTTHNQRTPARSGWEPQPGPSARIGEGPTTTTSGPQPGMARNRTHGPQPGLARVDSPPQPADPSQDWRETATMARSQDLRGTSHHHNQRTPARSGREPHQGPSARIAEGPPTTTSS